MKTRLLISLTAPFWTWFVFAMVTLSRGFPIARAEIDIRGLDQVATASEVRSDPTLLVQDVDHPASDTTAARMSWPNAALQTAGSLESFGTDQLQLRVSDAFNPGLIMGSATYHHDVRLPPGTHGLSPNVDLAYSSTAARGVAGVAGLGWSLPLSRIERDVEGTPNTLADDTFTLTLNNQADELVLNPADGRYHSKIENFFSITYQASGAPNAYGGWWTAIDKTGTTYRFGYDAGAENACMGRPYAIAWYLDEIVDSNGNHVYFHYLESPHSLDLGAVYLDRIEYNNDRSRVIQFTYDSSERPDRPTDYSTGCPVRYGHRLQSISMRAEGSLVRSYTLAYNDQTNSVLSQLTSITEVGSDGSQLPPTVFTYQNENRSWRDSYSLWAPVDTPFLDNPNVELHDVNRDGLIDIVDGNETWKVYLNTGLSWNVSGTTWLTQSGHELQELDTEIIDVNNDGLPDIVEGEGTTWYVNVNNGNGWNGRTGWPAGSDHNLEELDTVLVDVNGDDLPDIVEGEGTNFTVNLNYGGGWSSPIAWPAGSAHNLEEADTVLVDVTGDGLPDIVEGDETWTVNINNGWGWNSPQTWLAQDNHKLDEYDTTLSDVNGDGFVDIVEGDGASGYDVNLNNGSGWSNPVSWTENGPDLNNKVALADANGDGYPDIVARLGGQGWLVYRNSGVQSNLLVGIRNSLGGSISVAYSFSAQFDNTGPDNLSDLGFSLWTVSRVVRDNGVSGDQHYAETTDFTYRHGLHDYADREFRGFGEVVELNGLGARITHFYHQDDALKGNEYLTEVRDTADALFSQTERSFTSAAQGAGYVVSLSSVTTLAYDGAVFSPRSSSTAYQYDAYGNVTAETYSGDTSVSGDEYEIVTEYTYNTGAWIVNKPKLVKVVDTAPTTVIERTSWFYYDGQANLDAPPIRGNLTKQEDWLVGSANRITTYEYDSNGNQTRSVDPNGHVNQCVYGIQDLTRTHCEQKINAKNQSWTYMYDLGTGNLLAETDPNGYSVSYQYDVFGRLTGVVRPYDSESFPTTVYQYVQDGIAPEGVLIAQRQTSGQPSTLDTYTFADGLGRVLQTRMPAENPAQQTVTNVYYNAGGLAEQQSVPHLVPLSTAYSPPVAGIRATRNTFDVLGRVSQVTNPDNTAQTNIYDRWRIDHFDENGHRTSQHLDAFQNVVQVDEYNAGAVYTTRYEYSVNKELLRITDHLGNVFAWEFDSLGRQVEQADPDLGRWTFVYDLAGNLVTKTDARGVGTRYQYDELNRVVLEDYPTQTDTRYTYDVGTIGVLSTVENAAGTVNYVYDLRLRMVREEKIIDGLTWNTTTEYDAADRVTSLTYPDGEVVTYSHNAQGQVENVGGLLSDLDYDAFNRVSHKEFANGVSTTLAYSPEHFRLERIQTPGLQDLVYTFDPVGNITSITDNERGTVENFAYDGLNRLITAEEPAGYSHIYSYNAIGNLMTVTTDLAEMAYTYGQDAGPHAVTGVESSWRVPLIATELEYPRQPLVGESVSVTFELTNVSNDAVVLDRVLAGVHGPFCPSWDCPNTSDFPVVEDIVLAPGQSHRYEQARAFNHVDNGYLLQALTVDSAGVWRSHSQIQPFEVLPGIEVIQPVSLSEITPLAGEPITATFTIQNQGDRAITLERLGIVAKGPNCTSWDCPDGWADFPFETDVTIQPGAIYTYTGQRQFWTPGSGYFADAAFSDTNGWSYLIPGNDRFDFAVVPAFEVVGPVTLSPSDPLVGEEVTAQFNIRNASNRNLEVEKLLMVVRGPYCSDWDCTNSSDFPWVAPGTIAPGAVVSYTTVRAFNIPDEGYLAAAHTLDGTGVWRSVGSTSPLVVRPGIQVIDPIQLSTTHPLVGEVVTATYTILNTGDRTITLAQLGIVAKGPDCASWDCPDGWADFPFVTNVTIDPGEAYTYSKQRQFWTPGSGYFADAAFTDSNGWSYLIPGNDRFDFSVAPAFQLVGSVTLSPTVPLVGEEVTAQFSIRNVSNLTLEIDRLLMAVRGPYCMVWDCPNGSDFPLATPGPVAPGSVISYTASRAFNVADAGYLASPHTLDPQGLWRSVGPTNSLQVLPGIRVLNLTQLTPANPAVGDVVRATYTVINDGNRTITLKLGLITRGPNCVSWDCNGGWADFPFRANVTVLPGDSFTYSAERPFSVPGGYFVDIAFGDSNNWWYVIPGNLRTTFTVYDWIHYLFLPFIQNY